VPREFWDYEELRDALIGERHIGHAVRRYRHHPYHGRTPIPVAMAAQWFNISQPQLSRIEAGRRIDDLGRLIQWAKILRIPPDLLWFSLPGEPLESKNPEEGWSQGAGGEFIKAAAAIDGQNQRPTETRRTLSEEEEGEDMERRRLLQSLAALGVEISPLGHALDTVRTVFGDTVGYDERNNLDHWEEAVIEHGYSYLTTSPSNLIPDLAVDLVTVRSVIRRLPKESSEYRSWCRVGGALSGLTAKSLSNLGYSRDSRVWWDMAQHLGNTYR
jgi:transcriptional regulator with XRE-family HTH domain